MDFDIFDPVTLHLLANNLVIALGAAFAFVVIWHLATQNPSLGRKDVFFMLAGPAVGFLGTVLGLPQVEVIMYTFTVNMSVTGAKETITKVAEWKKNNSGG